MYRTFTKYTVGFDFKEYLRLDFISCKDDLFVHHRKL